MKLDAWYKSPHFLTASALRERQLRHGVLSLEEKIFLCVYDFVGEAFNGGFEQWFHNCADSTGVSIPGHLRTLGLNPSAEIAERAIALYFPKGVIPDDEGVKWEEIERVELNSPEIVEGIVELTNELWRLDENIYGSLVQYAIRNGFAVYGSEA